MYSDTEPVARNDRTPALETLTVFHIKGEHKNSPRFQVVIKSKLTGIFLQNWWLQLHKLIQKFLELMYLQSHFYKNIPVSFDFITTSNQGVFLCSPCIMYILL